MKMSSATDFDFGVRAPFRPNTQGQIEAKPRDAAPSREFFQKYSIGEGALIFGKDELISAEDVRTDHFLYTREFGFMQPSKIVKSKASYGRNSPVAIRIHKNGIGGHLPSSSLTVGSASNLVIADSKGDRSRPKMLEKDLSDKGHLFLRDPVKSADLYTFVFPEAATVLVCGVYVVCPGIDELLHEYSLTGLSISDASPAYA